MKKIFTLIASALFAMGVNAQIQTIAGYTVTTSSVVAQDPENETIKNRTDEGTACTVQLHATTISTQDGINYGIKLDSDSKYIQIDLDEELQAGDAVKISYFMGSSIDAKDPNDKHGVQLLNLKPGTEGSEVLAAMYATAADKKDVVTKSYTAVGGEKKFFVYKLSESASVFFNKIEVTRGSKEAKVYTLDFANPVLTTVAEVEASIKNSVNLTIAANASDASQFVYKNTAGQTASFTFVNAPISISYKNSSAKEFCKYGKSDDDYYFQFNNTPITVEIDCAKGQYISLYPISYGTNSNPDKVKNGKFEITNGKNVADNTAVINIPAGTTDVATVEATADGVTLKCTGACRLAKITITNEKPTAVAGVAESKSEAKKVVKVLGANGIQIGNYNIAGQQVK